MGRGTSRGSTPALWGRSRSRWRKVAPAEERLSVAAAARGTSPGRPGTRSGIVSAVARDPSGTPSSR